MASYKPPNPPRERVIDITGFPQGVRLPSNTQIHHLFAHYGVIQSIHHSISSKVRHIFVVFETIEAARAAVLIRDTNWDVRSLILASDETVGEFNKLSANSSYQTRHHEPHPTRSNFYDPKPNYDNNGNSTSRTPADNGWNARRRPSPNPSRRPPSPPSHHYDRNYHTLPHPTGGARRRSSPPPMAPSRERSPYSVSRAGRPIVPSPPPVDRIRLDSDRDRSFRGGEFRRSDDESSASRYAPYRGTLGSSTTSYYPPAPSVPLRESPSSASPWNDRRRRMDDSVSSASLPGPDMKRQRLTGPDDPRPPWNSQGDPKRDLNYRPYEEINRKLVPLARDSFDSVTTVASHDTYRPSRFPAREDESRYRSSSFTALEPARENSYRSDYGYSESVSLARDDRDRVRDPRPRYEPVEDLSRGRDRYIRPSSPPPPPPPPIHTRDRPRDYPPYSALYRNDRGYDPRFDSSPAVEAGPPPGPPTPQQYSQPRSSYPPSASYSDVRPYGVLPSGLLHRSPERYGPPPVRGFEETGTDPRERERHWERDRDMRSRDREKAERERESERDRLDRRVVDKPRESERPREQDRDRRRHGSGPGSPITLFVSNLPHQVSPHKLREFFSVVGRENIAGLDTGRAGFAFVRIATMAAAELAVKELHHKQFEGFAVNVSIGKPPAEYKRMKQDAKAKRKQKTKVLKDQVKNAHNAKQAQRESASNSVVGDSADRQPPLNLSSSNSVAIGSGTEKKEGSVGLLGRIGEKGDRQSHGTNSPALDRDKGGASPYSPHDPNSSGLRTYSASGDASHYPFEYSDTDSDDDSSTDGEAATGERTSARPAPDESYIESFLDDVIQFAETKKEESPFYQENGRNYHPPNKSTIDDSSINFLESAIPASMGIDPSSQSKRPLEAGRSGSGPGDSMGLDEHQHRPHQWQGEQAMTPRSSNFAGSWPSTSAYYPKQTRAATTHSPMSVSSDLRTQQLQQSLRGGTSRNEEDDDADDAKKVDDELDALEVELAAEGSISNDA